MSFLLRIFKPDVCLKNAEKGTLRETFFANQAEYFGIVTIPETRNFLIDGKYLFEVGGRRKSFDQITNIPKSYLAIDDIEVGFGAQIPYRSLAAPITIC